MTYTGTFPFVNPLFLLGTLLEKSLFHSAVKGLFAFLLPLLLLDQVLCRLLCSQFLRSFLCHNPLSLLFFCLWHYFLFLCNRRGGLGLFLHLMLLLQHAVVLHCLPPNNPTPTWFNIVGLRANLIHLGRYHSLGSLVRAPLFDGAHGLGVELVHTSRFLLYVRDNWNISNAPLHQSLGKNSLRTSCTISRFLLTGFPSSFLTLGFNLIILIHSSRERKVELFSVEFREE
mmetsp:Transcript_28122/g.51220  ORF Transcript_28122/g.51220 Transcript_28122/m.51220 type:complete len:229 (-) Transcript_28122:337-1023(-)